MNLFCKQRQLDRIENLLLEIKKQGDLIMAQIDDLNAAIANLQAQTTELGTDLAAAIADLQAKIAAAGNAGPDLSGPITAILAVSSKLSAIDTADKGL
jgi:hypothetical protein